MIVESQLGLQIVSQVLHTLKGEVTGKLEYRRLEDGLVVTWVSSRFRTQNLCARSVVFEYRIPALLIPHTCCPQERWVNSRQQRAGWLSLLANPVPACGLWLCSNWDTGGPHTADQPRPGQ